MPTSDLVPLLADLLRSSSQTDTAYLCIPSIQHYNSLPTDKGWGCGYKNCQMLWSALISLSGDSHNLQIRNVLGPIPSISELQAGLETAWSKGFDPTGREQLHGKVHQTRKWIGATEIYSILSHHGLKVVITDFPSYTGPNNTHPGLQNFVWKYFSSSSESNPSSDNSSPQIIQTTKPPLYLQYAGHSITIVGIEKLKQNRFNLLIFDPSISFQKFNEKVEQYYTSLFASLGTTNERKSESKPKLTLAGLLKDFRYTSYKLSKHNQYQIVRVEVKEGILSGSTLESRKVVGSEVVR